MNRGSNLSALGFTAAHHPHSLQGAMGLCHQGVVSLLKLCCDFGVEGLFLVGRHQFDLFEDMSLHRFFKLFFVGPGQIG